MKKLFATEKEEGRRSSWYRRAINFWPCIWCTGSKITFCAADFTELHVQLDLNLRTRNRVGTVFGGSIYSSIDPHFMLMFMEIMGREYVCWDKAASFKFLRPITGKVKCRFLVPLETIAKVKAEIAANGQCSFDMPLQYEDDGGRAYAVFTKTIYVASKEFYKQKVKAKQD